MSQEGRRGTSDAALAEWTAAEDICLRVADEVARLRPEHDEAAIGRDRGSAATADRIVAALLEAHAFRLLLLWRTIEQVELATSSWVHRSNTDRLHSACGRVPPAEYETAYHQRLEATTLAA
jgi:transposase InsO family protein